MIAPKILLNVRPTPRTPLRRLPNRLPTRLLLRLLNTPISPIIVLRARFALVPTPIMIDAVHEFAAEAAELGVCVCVAVDLARGAAFGDAPAETGDGFYGGFGAEFVVAVKGLERRNMNLRTLA